MKTAVYFHVPLDSRWEQARAQEEAKRFLESRPELSLTRTYSDFGPSAGSRRALLSLLRDAGTGAFQALVLTAPNAVAREPSEILEILSYLSGKGVRILFSSGKEYPLRYWARQYARMKRELAS